MLLLVTSSSCTLRYISPRDSIRVFNTDYIEIYERTLNAMFDYEWTLISVEEIFVEALSEEYICCLKCYNRGHGRAQQFIRWVIEYQDGNGDTRHFEFDNRSPLALRIASYVEQYIAEYYIEHFFDVYMNDVPLAPSTRVSAWIVRAGVNRHLRENREWVRAADEYRSLLGTPEGTIRLSQLTPANAFEMIPIRLSVHVSFSGDYSLGQPFEEEVMRRIENMIEDMNRFTNNQLTASVRMGYHQIIDLHTGNRSYRWYYIQGERVYNMRNPIYFDRYIFESFRGVFW